MVIYKKEKAQFIGVMTANLLLLKAEVDYKDKISKSIDVKFSVESESLKLLE